MSQQVIFVSDGEALSLETRREPVLTINVGTRSLFSNPPPQDPWAIDHIDGITPYDLWFGLSQKVGRNLDQQLQAGRELVTWICQQITVGNLNPFAGIPTDCLPSEFQSYLTLRKEYEEKVAKGLTRADVYVVNGLYFVASAVSEDPGTLSALYKLLPHNKIDFSVVYNPEWGKMSIGGNTVGTMPQGSATVMIANHLQEARDLYQATGTIYISVVNLDVLTAVMLVEGHNLPHIWLKYVEALKLGNFTDRLNKRLPSLQPVSVQLSAEFSERWGGSPTFIGSPRGEKTKVTKPEIVLMAMASQFPKADETVEPFTLLRQGK